MSERTTRRALPPRPSAMTATLDALTDPVVPVTPVVTDTAVTDNNHNNAVARDNLSNASNPSYLVNSGLSVNRGTSDPRVNPVSGVNRDTTVHFVVSDNAVIQSNSVTRVTRKPGPPRTAEPRQHLKVRATLAEELRDAVSYMVDHGQPRTKLNEVIDQAVERWLAQAKKDLLGGEDFPARQSG